MSSQLSRVTIQWHGYVETVFTESPFKCKGKIAWILPLNGVGEMPYPFDSISCERVGIEVRN